MSYLHWGGQLFFFSLTFQPQVNSAPTLFFHCYVSMLPAENMLAELTIILEQDG